MNYRNIIILIAALLIPGVCFASPLTMAAKIGDIDSLKELLAAQVDLEERDREDVMSGTSLILAAEKGHVEAARLLLESGANVNNVNQGGNTALREAVVRGHEAMAELLLSYGASVDLTKEYGKRSPLYWAIMYNRTTLVKMLLEHRANPQAVYVDDETDSEISLIEVAKVHGRQEIAGIMVAAIAKKAPEQELVAKNETAPAMMEKEVVVVASSEGSVMNLRSGPGLDFPVIDQAAGNDNFELVAQSTVQYEGAPWYRVINKDGQEAFVWSGITRIEDRHRQTSKTNVTPIRAYIYRREEIAASSVSLTNIRSGPEPRLSDTRYRDESVTHWSAL